MMGNLRFNVGQVVYTLQNKSFTGHLSRHPRGCNSDPNVFIKKNTKVLLHLPRNVTSQRHAMTSYDIMMSSYDVM